MKAKFEFDLNTPRGMVLCGQVMNLINEANKTAVGVDLATQPDRAVVTYATAPEGITVPTYTSIPVVAPVVAPVVTPLAVVTEYVAPTVTPVVAPAVVPAVLPQEGTYTLNQLAVAASQQLVDTGRRQELIDVLAQFGIAKMTDLPLDKYSAFAAHLKAKGVNI